MNPPKEKATDSTAESKPKPTPTDQETEKTATQSGGATSSSRPASNTQSGGDTSSSRPGFDTQSDGDTSPGPSSKTQSGGAMSSSRPTSKTQSGDAMSSKPVSKISLQSSDVSLEDGKIPESITKKIQRLTDTRRPGLSPRLPKKPKLSLLNPNPYPSPSPNPNPNPDPSPNPNPNPNPDPDYDPALDPGYDFLLPDSSLGMNHFSLQHIPRPESEPVEIKPHVFLPQNYLFQVELASGDVASGRLVIPAEQVRLHFPGVKAEQEMVKLTDFREKDWFVTMVYSGVGDQYMMIDGWQRFVWEHALGAGDMIEFFKPNVPSHDKHFFIQFVRRAPQGIQN